MKIKKGALETSLKMTGKAGIIAFTILGVVAFLLTFLGMVFTNPRVMADWKILVGAIGGTIFVGVVIAAVLFVGRHILMKLVGENTDTTNQ